MLKADIAAAVAAGAIALASGVAKAHFVLQAPASWAEQDSGGNPQKSAPCGQADPQIAAVPTGAVTAFGGGQTVTVTIDETTFHPGHYRATLSTTGADGLPPDPATTLPGTCMALAIQDPPVFPVLADGALPHTDPFTGPQSFQVTLPGDVSCSGCTLQILEFMQADVGGSGTCFYHHCANISVAAAATDAGGGGNGAGGGCSCAVAEHRTSLAPLLALLGLAVVLRRRRLRRRRRLPPAIFITVPLIAAAAAGCGDDRPARVGFAVSPGNVERAWLDRVGTGPAQTAVACGRGAGDPVARALCRSPAPALGGLTDLYAALGFSPGNGGLAAVATHSLGLSARTVSALNPRIVVFPRYSPLDENAIAAVAFSRGEPFVEMVGYDAAANGFNFYLLVFDPGCRDGACAPADLLTERLEGGWTGWTLYADTDLEDTPLDCTSCHRPDGPGTRRRLLMRQFDGPWMHWGDFRGISSPLACSDADGTTTLVDGEIPADGADLLRAVDGSDGRHGGVAVADLVAAPSGYDLSSFLYYAAGRADGIGDIPCTPPDCAFSEPEPFPSQAILCDRLRTGRADGAGGAWDRYRGAARARGLPAPYFDPDVLDASMRARVAGDFAGFVATPASDGQLGDAFTRLSSLMDAGAARAIGFSPDESDAPDAMLRTMCIRCHGGSTDARLARSRFNAAALDGLDAETAREIVRRIALPRTSPDLMPPLRAGELPAADIDRITAFLTAR